MLSTHKTCSPQREFLNVEERDDERRREGNCRVVTGPNAHVASTWPGSGLGNLQISNVQRKATTLSPPHSPPPPPPWPTKSPVSPSSMQTGASQNVARKSAKKCVQFRVLDAEIGAECAAVQSCPVVKMGAYPRRCLDMAAIETCVCRQAVY